MSAVLKPRDAASEALSALVAVSGHHIAPESLYALTCELARIANDMSEDRDLRGVDAVVEHLDNAVTAAMDIKPATTICDACKGSGEGRHAGLCVVCGGKGEVQA